MKNLKEQDRESDCGKRGAWKGRDEGERGREGIKGGWSRSTKFVLEILPGICQL